MGNWGDDAQDPLPATTTDSGVEPFDRYDVPTRCRELLARMKVLEGTGSLSPWKWDIQELLEESAQQLRDARRVHMQVDRGTWKEITSALDSEQTASTLPVGLRKHCEELVKRRESWLGDFDSELRAMMLRGKQLETRLLFEDVDAGWFGNSEVSTLEVQRLLERHLEMHSRSARLLRNLKLVSRALQQQGAVSQRHAFQAKTMGEKLQSSLVCLAAVAVAPVPGSGEMWLATTSMIFFDKDQAWQHVVYEHPRDADSEMILNQFQCHSVKARQSLSAWLAMPPIARRGCVLVHNASARRISVKTHLVNSIDGTGEDQTDWRSALDQHPIGSAIMKSLRVADDGRAPIGAQRLAIVVLPKRPDMNWGWRGQFFYGEQKVGECKLREGGIFSFISVDCGIRVGDREEGSAAAELAAELAAKVSEQPKRHEPEPLQQSKNPFAADLAAANPFDGDLAEATGEAFFVPEVTDAPKEEKKQTTIEVVNETDERVEVRVYAGGHNESHGAIKLLRGSLADCSIGPDARHIFPLTATEGLETPFDVSIQVGAKTTTAEVVGGQVIFVDGILADSV
eukprot:CAMPEP_0194523876 /NCGR_PEP_ID=MMETSP0253-20130528/58887_1 /TAXON_ID=2966 /ORGANISM="Noctiluca scintillans" /LENGTH=568 /DNA_ID=CAMNT_0039368453 /DNA_START=37 /DNA_END=1743 /DNA_ORIENTATION=-